MSEYIDRESLINHLNQSAAKHYSRAVERVIELEPAADVAPVRRGYWKRDQDNRPTCSECYEEPYRKSDYCPPNYCPNCGAKMEVDHDN